MTSTVSAPSARLEVRNGRQPGLRAASRRPGSDQLRVPQPSVPLLERPRITDLIRQAAAHRVSVVSGPTGAGKTIACAMWASAAQRAHDVGWLSLSPADRRPARFWADVTAALAGLRGVPDDLVAELPDPADDAFPLRLVQYAQGLPAAVTLVLDDVQQLSASDVLPGVDLLVRHGPPALRLLLAGRHVAGMAVARLRVSGDLAEIGPSDLACTHDEADRYFELLGVDLTPAQRDELLNRTQGWITGLRLAGLRADQGKHAMPPWRITGDEPAVADYLRDEVLATQPTDRQRFLLRTSVTDEVCGELADALTAGSGGAAVLDQLCRENVMLQPVGAEAHDAAQGDAQDTADSGADLTAYRYHPLLLDLLRAQLRRELPDEVPLLTRRAARWQAAHAMPADAIRNAARAGDWDFAAQVLAQVGPTMLLPGPATALEPVLATFPASRCTSDAAVACTLAAAGVRTGDVYAAALHLDNAVSALHRCTPARRRLIAPWLQALRLMNGTGESAQEHDLIGASTALALESEATAISAPEHQAVGLLWCALGVSALAALEVPDARDALDRACGHLGSGDRPEFVDQARSWQALAHTLYGDLSAADEMSGDRHGVNTAGPDIGQAADPLPPLLADLAVAHACLARDDAATARRLLDRCESAADSPAAHAGSRAARRAIAGVAGQVIGSLAAIARAKLALCDGNPGAARSVLTRLRYEVRSARVRRTEPDHAVVTVAGPALAALDADIALRDGDVNRARLALPATPSGPSERADLLLAHARVMLAAGDCDDALSAVAPCLDGTASQITLQDQISALVTAAIANRRLGQTDQAADQLWFALALAEPDRLYRPFLDGGAAARSALTVLIRPPGQGATLAARILQRFESFLGRPNDQPAATTVPLTSSELAVLRFLPSHMTNQEIAEALFLSINTIKTHLRSVYRKLGVTTRRQAIARGDRLGLL